MTVVGDIHGQLQDLFSIFTINGLPCPQNRYLFNGDFIDRGPNGAEVLLTLCAFKARTVKLNPMAIALELSHLSPLRYADC